MPRRKQRGLRLPIVHIGPAELMDGNPEQISKGKKEDYVTVMRLVLPLNDDEFVPDTYYASHANWDSPLQVMFYQIEESSTDPIFEVGNRLRLGANMQLQNLPFSIFTDNRGKYPCFYALIVFPYRLDDWQRPSREEPEQYKLTGIFSKDKLLALQVLNNLFVSPKYPATVDPLEYEDITNVIEQYFPKDGNPSSPLYQHLIILDARNAFEEAIIEYLGEDLWEHVSGFVTEKKATEINTEADLHDVVTKVIVDVIKHHIENRRWIQAFWNEPHKIKVKGQPRTIPKKPKSEPSIQPTLFILLQISLTPLGIHVERETNEGIGSLDFKCLYTTKNGEPLRLQLEFKLAHGDIKHGLEKQLPAYLIANQSRHGIYLIMWFKDEKGKFFKKPSKHTKVAMSTELKQMAESIQKEKGFFITVEMIDASINPPASKS